MNSKITYHQQVSYCGKPRCRKCREGTGHGPYWYGYQTVEGRTTRTYIGKHLPPDVQAAMVAHVPPLAHESEREQSTIRIYVLGQFRLERRDPHDPLDWQTVTESGWQHQRVRALLGCLVSVEGRKLGREQIMDALWPDLDMETGGNRLDRAVYSLRQLFEPTRSKLVTSPFLLTEREMLVLSAHPLVWIDADVFEQLLAEAHRCEDPGKKEQLLVEASSLYGGEFLPEERKNEWTRARRETLLRAWIGLQLELSDLRSKRDALNAAIEPLDRLLGVDPTNEAAVQRLIMILEHQGRRGEALRAYKKLALVLQQEYRIAPLPETRQLYDALRAGAPLQKDALAKNGSTASAGRIGDAAGSQGTAVGAPREGVARGEAAIVQIGRAHLSPLVGREQELEMLRAVVTATEHAAKFRIPTQRRSSATSFDPQRRPQCVLLLGDVGIGKTRLAEEVSRDAKRRGWAVAWSRVYSQEGSIPYRLWTEVLRKAMGQGVWQRQKVSSRPVVFQPLCALLPELQDLFVTDVAFSPAPPEQEQLRLWDAARELLTILCENTPLLIALDDLQWADNGSCELLAYIARRIQGLPIVIVGTCRDNELPANHALKPLLTDLQRENAVESVVLERLSDEQIVSLVSYIPHVPEPYVVRIRNRAAGNPFFAEELARSLDPQGVEPWENAALSAANEEGQLTASEQNPLPDTIAAVLDLRMNRLSTACQRLLSKAAVLGSSFTFHLISEMEASMPGSDEDVVLDLLEEGLRSGMLTEEGVGTRITYHFWHPLLVNHLYDRLSAARRALLHRRAAEILRRIYQGREEEHAASITEHLMKGGGDAQQISHYAEMAGDHVYALSSDTKAAEYYHIALDHVDLKSEDWQRLAYLWECLGECVRIRGEFEEARRFYEQTLELHRYHCNTSSFEYKEEAQIQVILWCEIGLTWFYTGNDSQARRCYQCGEQVLQEVGIVDGPAWAYLRYLQSYVSGRGGNYSEARRTANEALDLFERVSEKQRKAEKFSHLTRTKSILAGDPINLGRTHEILGLISANGGQCSEALMHFNTALTIYEQHNRQREISLVSCNLGDVHLRKAELNHAQSFFRRSLSIAEQIGDTPATYMAFGNLGILAMRFGNLEEAEDWFKQCIVLTVRSHDPVYESLFSSYLSVVLQEQGKWSEAKASLIRALTVARATRIDPYIGRALVILGFIRLNQAVISTSAQEITTKSHNETVRLLQCAKKTLQRALAIESMEAETRAEGQLTLAYTMLLLEDVESALQLATQALEDARKFELIWLVAQAQSVLGSIAAALDEHEQASTYFDQALRVFRKNDMRLEQAITLQYYGDALVQRESASRDEYRRGVEYIREARQLFADCHAVLSLQIVDSMLAVYEKVSKI